MTDKAWLADRGSCSSCDETCDGAMASTSVIKTLGVIPGSLPEIFLSFFSSL